MSATELPPPTELTPEPQSRPHDASSKSMLRKMTFGFLKLAFTAGMLAWVYRKIVLREGASEIWARVEQLRWEWVVLAVVMQLCAIACSAVRWQRLLVGQGIHAPWRFLSGSIMIARFWGAFTPGGFTGFGGWRIFDVAKHTGKTARATAVIGVEVVLGQLAFGAVCMAASIFGFSLVGLRGLLMVNGFFVVVISAGLFFLARPRLFLGALRVLPQAVRGRIRSLVDAVMAYDGKGALLTQAGALGIGTHTFNNLIYVCAARALDVELSIGTVFFGSSLQIFATLIPASINGIGLRETAAVALYTTVGVALTDAILIPTVGFAAEMFVSAFGGLVFLLRRGDYAPGIVVEDHEREIPAETDSRPVPKALWPRPLTGLSTGLAAGMLAGVLVGLGEAAVVVFSGGGRSGLGVLWYGALAYGVFCGFAGGGLGFTLALTHRWMRRAAPSSAISYSRMTAAVVAVFGFALGAFRVRRDAFDEALVWKSGLGLAVLSGCVLAASLLFLLLNRVLLWAVKRRVGQALPKIWGSFAFSATLVSFAVVLSMFGSQASSGTYVSREHGLPVAAPHAEDAGDILFIVVDTLRADHLPSYGYERGSTPALDAFAQDAIRFDQAFANASWTRPSFASLLSGRHPSSHGVMSKDDALPDMVTTLPEVLRAKGYRTAGFVTNFNVGPYYNFQQGFDVYRYLEPEFVLGADDASAKLLLVQFLRQSIEKVRAQLLEDVRPGTAYQDAETVNRHVFDWLDASRSQRPRFLFVGYMDPHDPYFVHPYEGSGYARAAHQRPSLEEAPELRRLYDGEINFWDRHFGLLIEQLKLRELYDEMTIVVTSDHGEEFGDHGGFWHGTTLYDEQIHIPLFVKLPRNRRGGTVVRHWVQSIDVAPTLLRQLGLELPPGISDGDLFEGTDRVYAWEHHEGNELEALRERLGTEERKVILANEGNPRGLPPVALYRVDLDAAEQHDVALNAPEEVVPMVEALRTAAEAASVGAVERRKAQELDADAAERLRQLGYIE